jgi:dephospho-CoA kinase
LIQVGITGGIGSGKSTVCSIFERLGVPVYYADLRAKQLMEDDKTLISEIKSNFGEEAYNADNTLNRVYLSSLVFKNEDKLLLLNSLVHPIVQNDYKSWVSILDSKNYPYCLKEAALLVETGSFKMLDKLIVVSAPLEDRIGRVMARDNASREQVLNRINAQLPEAEKIQLAHFVIYNDKIMDLMPQVTKIHLSLTSSN